MATRICGEPGCPARVERPKANRCPQHDPGAWHGSTRNTRLPSNWSSIRQRVFRRDHHTCQSCGGERCGNLNLECDHIVPGDNHAMTNLQTLGKACHAAKTKRESAAARHPGGVPPHN